MQSKWYELKDKAVQSRRRGQSVRNIERKLGIPRSTLSGWFKNIALSKKHSEKLHQSWLGALGKARQKAALWHHAQKQQRLLEAKEYAQTILEKIDGNDRFVLELALAVLYIGEGRKKSDATALASSDPAILKFYLNSLRRLYSVDESRLLVALHLRADQNSDEIKKFWSCQLKLPLQNFKQVYKDKRTIGIKTYSHYKGVCDITYCDVSIMRRLVSLAELFFDRTGACSSFG